MANGKEYKRWESSIKKIRVKTPRRYGILLTGIILGFLVVGNLALYAEASKVTELYNDVLTQNENLYGEFVRVKAESLQLKGTISHLENTYQTIQSILTAEVSPEIKMVWIGNAVTLSENFSITVSIQGENIHIMPLER